MATTPALLSFLPWVREGAAAALAIPDTLGANMRGAATLNAQLAVNGASPQAMALRLRGPADVIGLDVRQIVRMDPPPGTADFEPNYFPAIEFDRADFPWLFTPASADKQGRLRPWLCLVVVRVQAGVDLRAASVDPALPVLEINAPAVPADELPDLAECWAWAHAQVASGTSTPADVRGALTGRPEQSLSRLLCPRLLTAHTDYLACVVPTFELGMKVGLGLGLEIEEADLTAASGLKPAWSLAPTPPAAVRLPVYHHWRFRTGARGDFESMVRLLRARPAPAGFGTRPMDVSEPGFRTQPQGALQPGRTLALEGALEPLNQGAPPPGWTAAEGQAFQTALAGIVNAPGLAQTLQPDAEPLLAPPLYGQWHAARPTVTPGATPWLDELNLDPCHRAVAALGTRVVQEHQEALMAAAWDQAAELQAANQRLRQLQLSLAAGASLHARHFARLSDEAALRVSAPVHARLRAVTLPSGGGSSRTLVADVQASMLPPRAASAAMRRIGRARGPLTRRVAAQGGTRSMQASWIVQLNLPAMGSFVSAPWWDVASFNIVRERIAQPSSLAAFGSITADAVNGMRGRPVFRIAAEGQAVAVQGVTNVPPSDDSPTAHSFRQAAAKHLERVNPARLGILTAPAPSLQLAAVRSGLQAQLEPRRTLVALTQALVKSSANATPAVNPSATAPLPIDTVMAAPRFPQPMYEPLRDLSQDLLLPGLQDVLPNTVLGLQTNRRFIEAYMVGLNVEMARELLWRGFPTDQRGTCFDRFWAATSPAVPSDIAPLHQWGARRLGDTTAPAQSERFVMLLRSELLRRYPSALIYAAKAVVDANGVRMPSIAASDEASPIFRGSLPPDVSFFGFDVPVKQMVGAAGGGTGDGYFVIIQEQPGEPRFGLDDGTPRGAATHLRVAAGAPAGLPLNGLQWGFNAAHMAGIVRQQPMRVAIHASQFLPPTA
ncbi:hypothetical protein WMF31_22815 [Sorangium sp. So ce1036]|uniref:hypothetical protein n=1 Tax=Sorangium sp. So ce1036 TaxID=3133328 RepID=UPI003F011C85